MKTIIFEIIDKILGSNLSNFQTMVLFGVSDVLAQKGEQLARGRESQSASDSHSLSPADGEDSEKNDNGMTLAVSIVFAVEMLIFFDI